MGLRVLAVDDEQFALRDLVRMLERSPKICEVVAVGCGRSALDVLADRDDIDAIFADISMPELDGITLGRRLRELGRAIPVAFVTAHDQHAVAAFDLDVVDYVLKPVAPSRLAAAVERIGRRAASADEPVTDDVLVSRLGERRVIINRSDVRYVEASGDYIRVHLVRDGVPDCRLVRASIGSISATWAEHGFIRTHRSFLVRRSAISEVRSAGDGGLVAIVDGTEVPVSRRYRTALNDMLFGHA